MLAFCLGVCRGVAVVLLSLASVTTVQGGSLRVHSMRAISYNNENALRGSLSLDLQQQHVPKIWTSAIVATQETSGGAFVYDWGDEALGFGTETIDPLGNLRIALTEDLAEGTASTVSKLFSFMNRCETTLKSFNSPNFNITVEYTPVNLCHNRWSCAFGNCTCMSDRKVACTCLGDSDTITNCPKDPLCFNETAAGGCSNDQACSLFAGADSNSNGFCASSSTTGMTSTEDLDMFVTNPCRNGVDCDNQHCISGQCRASCAPDNDGNSAHPSCLQRINGNDPSMYFCDNGYASDTTGTKCVPINLCESAVNPCGPRRHCIYTGPGNFACLCLQRCHNPCRGRSGALQCGDHARCHATPGGGGAVSCRCDPGFILTSEDGRNCVADPCNDDRNECGNNAMCTVAEDLTPTCTCIPGYFSPMTLASSEVGSSTTCLPDPCFDDNGGCSSNAVCTPHVAVTGDGETTHTCACISGYFSPTQNGTRCVVNPCAQENGSCGSNSTCTPLSQSNRTCTCDQGFVSVTNDGTNCQWNYCAIDNGGCGQNSTCNILFYGSVSCECKEGHVSLTSNGMRCQKKQTTTTASMTVTAAKTAAASEPTPPPSTELPASVRPSSPRSTNKPAPPASSAAATTQAGGAQGTNKTTSSSSSSATVPTTIGASVGGVAVAAGIVVAIVLLMKQRQRRTSSLPAGKSDASDATSVPTVVNPLFVSKRRGGGATKHHATAQELPAMGMTSNHRRLRAHVAPAMRHGQQWQGHAQRRHHGDATHHAAAAGRHASGQAMAGPQGVVSAAATASSAGRSPLWLPGLTPDSMLADGKAHNADSDESGGNDDTCYAHLERSGNAYADYAAATGGVPGARHRMGWDGGARARVFHTRSPQSSSPAHAHAEYAALSVPHTRAAGGARARARTEEHREHQAPTYDHLSCRREGQDQATQSGLLQPQPQPQYEQPGALMVGTSAETQDYAVFREPHGRVGGGKGRVSNLMGAEVTGSAGVEHVYSHLSRAESHATNA